MKSKEGVIFEGTGKLSFLPVESENSSYSIKRRNTRKTFKSSLFLVS